MAPGNSSSVARYGHIRAVFWALLMGALLVALIVPAASLWHAASSSLIARVCLLPMSPRAGQTARLTIDLPNATDRTATEGPWAEAVVEWDMATMAMGTRPATVPGSSRHPGSFSIPLYVGMAGTWWANVALRTPGRPVWQTELRFTVLPPSDAAPATAIQTAPATSAGCANGGRSAPA